jgi:hypothetical protein
MKADATVEKQQKYTHALFAFSEAATFLSATLFC